MQSYEIPQSGQRWRSRQEGLSWGFGTSSSFEGLLGEGDADALALPPDHAAIVPALLAWQEQVKSLGD